MSLGKSTHIPYDFRGRYLKQVRWVLLQEGILEIPSGQEQWFMRR